MGVAHPDASNANAGIKRHRNKEHFIGVRLKVGLAGAMHPKYRTNCPRESLNLLGRLYGMRIVLSASAVKDIRSGVIQWLSH